MDSKKYLPGLWGVIAISMLTILALIVLAFIQPSSAEHEYQALYAQHLELQQAYKELTGEYESLYQDYESVHQSREDVVGEYRDLYQDYVLLHQEYLALYEQYGDENIIPIELKSERLPANALRGLELAYSIPEIAEIEEKTFSNTYQVVPFVLIIVLGFGGLAIIVIMAYQYYLAVKGTSLQNRTDAQKQYEQGRRDRIVSLASDLVSDQDVLADLSIWLREYEIGKARLDKAAHVQQQLLDRLMRLIRLYPLMKVLQEVQYNPDEHITYDVLRPGETVIVIEPGWRVGSETIKKPVVEKRRF
jgi:hypothetical protein